MYKQNSKRIYPLVFIILIITLNISAVGFFHDRDSQLLSKSNPNQEFSDPKVVRPNSLVDMDNDKIDDKLAALIQGDPNIEPKSLEALRENGEKVKACICVDRKPDDALIEKLRGFGADILTVFDDLIYAIYVILPVDKLSVVAAEDYVSFIQKEYYSTAHLDTSTVNMGIRGSSYVWDATPAIKGNPHYSIAILDTGVDSTHSDMSNFLYFQDFSGGGYPSGSTGYDYGHHGTHCASIAAGTGAGDTNPETVKQTYSHQFSSTGVGYYYTSHRFEIKDNTANPDTTVTMEWDNSGGGTVRLGVLTMDDSWVYSYVVASGFHISIYVGQLDPGWYKVYCAPNSPEAYGKDYTVQIQYEYDYMLDDEPTNAPVFTGVAPQSNIISLKVLDDTGHGNSLMLLNALTWILNNGKNPAYNITTVSMSLGFDYYVSSIDAAVNNLVNEGFICVASAGNDGTTSTMTSPGTAQKCITVGAVNDAFEVVYYSSNGDNTFYKPDVIAPGGTFATSGSNSPYNGIIAADSNYGEMDCALSDPYPNDYLSLQGTSMACPHVAGLAQLAIDAIINAEGSWTWSQANALRVKQLICMGTWEVNAGETYDGDGDGIPQNPSLNRIGRDNVEGYGMVRADAVIQAITSITTSDMENVPFYLNRGSGVNAKEPKVVLFSIDATVGETFSFSLDVPSTGDFDLIIYDNDFDSPTGRPVVSTYSINSGLGADESLVFSPSESGIYYWSIRAVEGYGTSQLSLSGFNSAPNAPNNPTPIDEAIDVSINPTLSVDVFDPDGNAMDVSFYNASDDNLIDTDTGVSSGGTASISWLGLSGNTEYEWYAIADDGIHYTQSATWSFTTGDVAPNAPTNPTPIDGAIGISINPTLSVDVFDPDGDAMDVSFYNASDDSLIDTDTGVSSGGTASISWLGLSGNTEYEWYAIADDGALNTQSVIWSFTTINTAPSAPINPTPAGETTDVFYLTTLSVDVSDPDGDMMDVSFYNAFDDSLIGTDTDVSSGGTASISWGGLSGNTEYEWYAIADDGALNTQSATWTFTTVNTAPDMLIYIMPTDGATGVSLNPILYVYVSDADGDVMDVSFYDASDDNLIDYDLGIPSGGTAGTLWYGLSEGTIYNWYVVASDGKLSTYSSIWTFTTYFDIPTWDQTPTDQVIEFGDTFEYDLNASDLSGINHWWINDTSNFNIDGDGIITNVASLPVGEYWLEVRAYDPFDNYCTKVMQITIEDTIAPTWDQTPTDQSLKFGEDLVYDVNASDLSGIDHWWISDLSNFSIDSNGIINNTTTLLVGEYLLEVRAYDAYDNYCTITFIISIEPTGPDRPEIIPGFNLIILFFVLIGISMLLVKKKVKFNF